MNTILIAVLAGIGGMFGWGLADFFAKKTIDEIGDVVSLVWGHIFGSIAVFIGILYLLISHTHSFVIPSAPSVWIGLAFFGALQGAVYLFVYRGFGKGQLALLNPVFASYSGVVALISILFLGEVIHISLLFSLVILVIGLALLNIDPASFKNRKVSLTHVPGFKEVATAAVLAAVWTLGWDQFVHGQDWITYAALMYIFMSVALLLYVFARKISLNVMKPHLWKYVVLIGLCETAGYVAISWGFGTTTHTSIVALLSSAFSIPTIFLARIFLKEKTTRLQTIGTLVIIAGVILVSVL